MNSSAFLAPLARISAASGRYKIKMAAAYVLHNNSLFPEALA
jgi:hypothetical protein